MLKQNRFVVRAPVDTSLMTEGVTLFKCQLLLLLLLLLLFLLL